MRGGCSGCATRRSSAPELAAAPEYVNAAAYAALKPARYAFTLPFDLDHTEATAYFERFGLERAQLMSHLRTGAGPAPAAIAAESAGADRRAPIARCHARGHRGGPVDHLGASRPARSSRR